MKNLTRVHIVLTLFMAAFIFALSGCNNDAQNGATSKAHKSSFERISDTKALKVGYIVYPPIVTKDLKSGELSGHFVDTIEHVAFEAGFNIEYVETDWSGFKAGLDSDRFDMSIAPTYATIKRSLGVAFTRPLLFAGQSAIAKSSDDRFLNIKDVKELDKEGLRIAVLSGQAGHDFAKKHFERANIVVLSGVDVSLAYQAVLSGQADAALGDAPSVVEFVRANPKAKDLFKDKPYDLTPVSWATKHENVQLLNFLNTAIETLLTQGKIKEFEAKANAKWLHEKVIYTYD